MPFPRTGLTTMGENTVNKPESKFSENLRIHKVQRGRKIRIVVNGRKISAYEGESVHAALTAAGLQNFRISKTGEPRGVFCGMGICYECLVTIDNISDQRACMTLVKDGMEIITQVSGSQKQKLEGDNMGGDQ